MTALTEDARGYVTFEGAPRWVGPARAEVDYWKARALAAEAALAEVRTRQEERSENRRKALVP
jgi:hypothetical protein